LDAQRKGVNLTKKGVNLKIFFIYDHFIFVLPTLLVDHFDTYIFIIFLVVEKGHILYLATLDFFN
jgi:hypothetical protein